MAVTTFAAIDIGSYEVSMKIFELSKKNGLKELNDVRFRLEVGKGVYTTGRLDGDTIDSLCDILNDFHRIMKEFGVEKYRVCATSAFREVINPLIVSEQIFQRTGMQIDILSNTEQHFLGYKSIAAIETGFKKMIQKGTAILDVGGGSLQVSLFDKDSLVTTQNLKIGSLRIRERLKDLQRTNSHYDTLIHDFIRNDLMAFQRLYLKDRDIKNVILLGDFLTETLFRDERADNVITKDEFSNRYKAIKDMSDHELAEDMGIEEESASLIIPMMIVINSFMDIFNAESLWMPGVSLMDGIAYDFGEKQKVIKSKHNFENDILVASRNIAKRYSSAKNHLQGTTDLALELFDSTKKIHGMGARERLLLQIAVLLHDCGKYISMGDVAECSYRIIMATEIIGLSTEERQIIASAVRYNSSEFAYYPQMSLIPGIDKNNYMLIAKLSAILRLANAMDRSHYQKVRLIKTVLKDRDLQIIIDYDRDVSLEIGLLIDKVKFFEEVFGIRMVIKRKRKV